MTILSGLALILLVMVGYATGAVLVGYGKKVTPGLLDVLSVPILWSLALATRGVLGRWPALAAWFFSSLAVGALTTTLRRGGYPSKAITSELPSHGVKGIWERWKVFGTQMGNYQSRVWLTLFYFLLVSPFGLVLKLSHSPKVRNAKQSESAWVERENRPADLASARSQF